jgi:hypothetical protein
MSQISTDVGDFAPPEGPPPRWVRPVVLTPIEELPFHHTFHKQGWTKLDLAHKPPVWKTMEELLQASHDFFKTPDDHKKEWAVNEEGTEEGYYSVEGEKEYYTIRHSRCPAELKSAAMASWSAIHELFEEVLGNIEISLSLSEGALKRFASPAKTLDETRRSSMLRLFRYDWTKLRVVSERMYFHVCFPFTTAIY